MFLAALACETKVKDVLRTRAAAAQQPLLELIISDRPQLTIRYLNLFDPLCKAVTGCSLKQDGPDSLWQALELPNRARNAIAHSGGQPEREDAERHLETAMRLFDWLDALPASRT